MNRRDRAIPRLTWATRGSAAGDRGRSRTARPPGSRKSTDRPSWVDELPGPQDKSGKDFAERMMNKQWGRGNWEQDPQRQGEFRKIQKWADGKPAQKSAK